MKTSTQTNNIITLLKDKDPILWASIMGHDTLEALEHLYPNSAAYALQLSLIRGYTHMHGQRILPTHPDHKQLRHLIRQRSLRAALRKATE